MAGGILSDKSFGGPIHRAPFGCGCTPTNCCALHSGKINYMQSPGSCAPSAGQSPIDQSTYQCSLGVTLQSTVDISRRYAHSLGMRPYRVFLVWQERDTRRIWNEHFRWELMPVRILAMDAMEVATMDWGESLAGGISLSEISPQQATEDTLRGYIDGEEWVSKGPDREFFYEVELFQRCPTDLQSRKRRFYPATEPDFDAQRYQFKISIGQQKVERSRDGIDQTIGTVTPDGTPVGPGPKLVT